MDNEQKRQRSINFTPEETNQLLLHIEQFGRIIGKNKQGEFEMLANVGTLDWKYSQNRLYRHRM